MFQIIWIKKYIVLGIIKKGVLIMFFTILTQSCNDYQAEKTMEDPEVLRAEVEPTFVKTDTVRISVFNEYIEAVGTVAFGEEAVITAQTSGVIEEIKFLNGDYVRKSNVIVKLNNEQEKLELEKAKINLKEKQTDFQSALIGYVSKNISDTITENLRYSSGLALAEITLEASLLNYENTYIKAPISGVITNIKINQGELINKGEEIGFMFNNRKPEVLIEITPSQAIKVKKGQKVLVNIENDLKVTGKVININPITDKENGLVKVRVWLPSLAQDILYGLSVGVKINIPHNNSIIVPSSAIVDRNGREVIFTLKSGKAIWNYVETGRNNGEQIEIKSGLKEGDIVIIENNIQLGHEALVTTKRS